MTAVASSLLVFIVYRKKWDASRAEQLCVFCFLFFSFFTCVDIMDCSRLTVATTLRMAMLETVFDLIVDDWQYQ